MEETKYVIKERIAVLSAKGQWTKELNVVSWHGGPAKYDLRDWNHEKVIAGKGFTLNEEEMRNLRHVLNALEL